MIIFQSINMLFHLCSALRNQNTLRKEILFPKRNARFSLVHATHKWNESWILKRYWKQYYTALTVRQSRRCRSTMYAVRRQIKPTLNRYVEAVIFLWTEIETKTKIMNFHFTKTETKTKIIFKTKIKIKIKKLKMK